MSINTRFKLCLWALFLPAQLSAGVHAEQAGENAQQQVDPVAVLPEMPSALEQRMYSEDAPADKRFVITPHKPNYLIPLSYNDKVNTEPYSQADQVPEELEIKFQFSFKIPVKRRLAHDNLGLYFGFTQVSFWQAYNSEASAPFRETNYEPELMLLWRYDKMEILGLNNRMLLFGLSHQSNGRSGSLSRSWNRLYVNFLLEKENFALSFKPWWRITESAAEDDNPDIEKFMGHAELAAAYKYDEQVFSVMLRNNLHSENRGALQLDWSFPVSERLNGYIQYFNGYGESLIDYNARSHRIGIGVLLTNWL